MLRNSLKMFALLTLPLVFGCSTSEIKPDTKEVIRDEEQYKKGLEQSMEHMPEHMRAKAQQQLQQPGAGS